MTIRVTCPNGHVLNVKDSFAGKMGLCPTCKARVQVPMPKPQGISDDAIMNILETHRPTPPPPAEAKKKKEEEAEKQSDFARIQTVHRVNQPKKACPNCKRELHAGIHICPHCQTYIAELRDF